jgi:predicted GIY-YIG superfamily endonuclease
MVAVIRKFKSLPKSVCGIYRIRNLVNGKFYIGSSKDIRERYLHHTSDLRLQISHN